MIGALLVAALGAVALGGAVAAPTPAAIPDALLSLIDGPVPFRG